MIALVWVACLFCSVTRDYTSVTGYFALGMAAGGRAVTIGYNLRPDLAIMLWGFNIGLGLTLFGLLGRIIATFPFAVTSSPHRRARFARAPPALLADRARRTVRRDRRLDRQVGGLAVAVRHQIQNGLLHAPLYDSAMFVSYLVVIPAYAAFVVHLEVKFFRNYRLFYSSILEHATLAQIRAHGRRLRDETIASLSGITVPQLVICALVAVSAPAVVDLLDMQFRQVGTLRLGVIGAAFQFLFITCSSLTLYFDRRIGLLRCCRHVHDPQRDADLGADPARRELSGPRLPGRVGDLGTYRVSRAARTLYRLDYLTFIANNPAVRIRRRTLRA